MPKQESPEGIHDSVLDLIGNTPMVRLGRQLPVLSGGVPVGCVTEQDLAGRLADFESAGRGGAADFGEQKVAEVMGEPLPTLQLGSSLSSPLGFFRERQAVLLLDGREPAGILTMSDAVQYLLKA